jgi:LTXXQ motif family protein
MTLIGRVIAVAALMVTIGAGAAYAQMFNWHSGDEMGLPMMMRRFCESDQPITGERIAEHLSNRLRLTDAQKPALKELQEAFAKSMADAKALCDQTPDFATIPGRIAFAQKRMAAMAAGLSTIQPKLEAFYTALDDKQKEAFNEMGPMGRRHHGWDEHGYDDRYGDRGYDDRYGDRWHHRWHGDRWHGDDWDD